jgi:protein phosphatase
MSADIKNSAEVLHTEKSQNGSASLQLHFGGYSSAGIKEQNQDAFAAYIPSNDELQIKGAVATIADGVSSASKAAEAAQLAVTQFIQEYYCTPPTWSTDKSASKVLTSLNQWLYSQTDPINGDTLQWLTTFSALIVKSSTGYLFHVGDSRVTRYRKGTIECITRDHNRTIAGQSAILTRALGADPRLKVDFHKIDVKTGDIFLLTCDGVHDFISNKAIKELLLPLEDKLANHPINNQRLEQLSKSIVDLAIASGSHDNVSCLLVYIEKTPNRKLEEIERDLQNRRIPPALQVGMKLDGYKVCKVLHASIRSHLYLVEHSSSNTPLVLKAPSQNFSDDPLYLQGFMREAWVGERIKHRNVMRVVNDQKDSQFLYHICEYVDGQTLTQWMHDHPKPSISQVRDIIVQVIAALRTFQRLELVHRDLKPDNIMIDPYGHITLIDYGTVLIASLDEDNDAIKEEVPQGSLNYIAPETLLELKADNLSDLFSLGVICYEMLSGQLPFKPMKRAMVTQTHYGQWQYRKIKQYRASLPFWLDICLQKCTNPDPQIRYQAFSEFEADLNKPNLSAIEEYKKLPILERNPVKFWQGVSLILLVALISSLI